jgi:uncharacterized repeat protein (TIGR02543 family)
MKILNRRTPRRFTALLVAVLTAFVAFSVPAFAEHYSDTANHWGAAVIEKWSDYDVLQGDGDGTFAPNRDMSVAELATVLAKTFGYTDVGNPAISQAVPSWAIENVKKAVTAGVIGPDETDMALTRELAAKILAKAFEIAPVPGATAFTDDAAVSAAYRPYARALSEIGAFKGDTAFNFMPKKGFTRAEIMQVLDNTVTDIVKESTSAASDKALIVNTPGVILTGGTAVGDIIIAQGVGNGDVTLTDVEIKGRLIIEGGGNASVHIRGNSTIPNIVANKTFGVPVRVVVESADASVGTVTVAADSKAIIETVNNAAIDRITLEPKVEASAAGVIEAVASEAKTELTIAAKATEVSIEAADVKLALAATAQVESVISAASAANAEITVASGATVAILEIGGEGTSVTVNSGATVNEATIAASDVTIAGAGKLNSVTVTGADTDNVAVTVPGATVENDSGATVSLGGGKTVDAGGSGEVAASGSGGPGGSGSPAPSTPAVTYTVTFESNGGSEIAQATVSAGGKASAPTAPTKDGYVFGGWYSDAGFTALYDFNTVVTGNITLHAKWNDKFSIKTQGYDYSASTDKLVLTFSDAISTEAAIDFSGASVNLSWNATNTTATITPVNIGKTDIPAIAFTSVTGETASSNAATLYKVDAEATRASLSGTVKVLFADADRPFARIDQSGSKWVHFAADADILNILRAVYLPNATSADAEKNAKSGALFHINIGAAPAGDLIEVKGTDIPAGASAAQPFEIQVGTPGQDNGGLPDFVIPPGGLGDGSTSYGTTRIVVNNGAYLNIDSDQAFADVYASSPTGHTPTDGKFRDGNITVQSGGKLRDSAYKLWPLGNGSTLSILEGGALAVGKGNSNGEWADSAVTGSTAPTDSAARDWYTGWLIGGSDAKIQLGGETTESFNDAIEVRDGYVMVNGSAIVKQDISLMYDVLITRGSRVTIESGKTVLMLTGKTGGGSYEFYGQPAGSSSSWTTPSNSDPSKLVLNGGAAIYDAATSANKTGAVTLDAAVASGLDTIWQGTGSFYTFIIQP